MFFFPPLVTHCFVTSSEQGLPHLHCHHPGLAQGARWWRFHRCSFHFIARGHSLPWGPWLIGFHIFLSFFHNGPWVFSVGGGAVEVSIGARHPDVTCSLCFGQLWLSVMVSVCRLALSTGHLILGLLNKNLLVELFDHMVEPTWFLPTLHTGFLSCSSQLWPFVRRANYPDRCAITLTLVLICFFPNDLQCWEWCLVTIFFMSLERCLFKSTALLLSRCSISRCMGVGAVQLVARFLRNFSLHIWPSYQHQVCRIGLMFDVNINKGLYLSSWCEKRRSKAVGTPLWTMLKFFLLFWVFLKVRFP